MLTKDKLGPAFTEPPCCPNVTGYSIIDLLTDVLFEEKKNKMFVFFSNWWHPPIVYYNNNIWDRYRPGLSNSNTQGAKIKNRNKGAGQTRYLLMC